MFKTEQQIFIEKELERIADEMRILDPKSEEYAVLERRYSELLELRGSGKSIRVLDTIFKAAEVGIAAYGTVVIPLTLAKMSYVNDQNMNLCNSRIWNLIGKGTKAKV